MLQHVPGDDLYLLLCWICAHEQKARVELTTGAVFATLMNDLKHKETSF